ncbi:predicted protein [Postia placenta Mad-698-R]|uniref:Transcription factor domain-containing protein n=1 Tax=Postia placenta MAD-698-R-SB12 TaxID=670580 RepID=A0A1X6NCA3_9APHY|nr:hypothetical protein POSPLADRAFT_1131338 [Postia placenta MAD-698-R-SB12]EED78390.1 predicted protein [Postia placenta Mad-698-R]OSX66140.1 hypothetical protein POSPLADRAFT_1131338 [Postia placenta MAD-698-R-SB12]
MFYKCLEEAQGVARSSLFGPVVRKEAVQGMFLLAAWGTNGWLPSGHAMRMALNLGLHRALENLTDHESAKKRMEEEERAEEEERILGMPVLQRATAFVASPHSPARLTHTRALF